MRVLITRPERDAERTAARVAALGHEPILAPLSRIIAMDPAWPRETPDALIATSRNGAPAAASSPYPKTVPLYAVGSETAAACSALGFRDVREGGGTASATARRIRAECPPGARLLYCAGSPRKPDLEAALAEGYALDVVTTYRSEYAATLPPEARSALADAVSLVVLHLSRGAAEGFIRLAGEAGLIEAVRKARHLVVSEDAAVPLRSAGCLEIGVSQKPALDGVLELLRPADAGGVARDGFDV